MGNSEKIIRCAVYCRKSTTDGLEQDFNSIDAQREAAEAYIASQKHEGWVCLPEKYEDAGFSGGNMDRPGLKRLLADIESSRIDCLVTYKVDRLSRSLMDFARLMEIFERKSVSFVSITQQFNTTHSMGRLTLNILLSFAQFEREIIAERTSDKIRASRRRGKWTGGMLILGYDVAKEGGRLIVNPDEAAMVQTIFQLYLEKRSLLETARELNKRRWRTKEWTTKTKAVRGGRRFNKANLYILLKNPLYIGKVRLKDEIFEGEHEAIISEDIWQSAQSLLKQNGSSRSGSPMRYKSLMKGILYCIPCQVSMNHTYTRKNRSTRYRYYVCARAAKEGWDVCPTKSVSAKEIEDFVVEQIRSIGKNHDLANQVLAKTKEALERKIAVLKLDEKVVLGSLKRCNSKLHVLLEQTAVSESDYERLAGKLADLQERIQKDENRLAEIRKEIKELQKEKIERWELSTALSNFGSIWDSLSIREQARVLHLLIDKVGYDGEAETVSITFHPAGIKLLSRDAAPG